MISKIGIIGAGKLGTDIFNYLSNSPFQITMVCFSAEEAEKTHNSWLRKQKRQLKHGLIDEHTFNDNLSRINCISELKGLSDKDLIIECIFEDQKLKSELFKELNQLSSADTIFASNTSSIPLATLIPSETRARKFVGLHFFYPVALKNLVEVNTTQHTETETLNTVTHFLNQINKYHLILDKNNSFLINKLFLKLQAGTYNLHIEENIPVKLLDNMIKEFLFPVGVFEMIDHVGIDVVYTSALNYTRDIAEKSFYTPWLEGMKQLLDRNALGVKSGKGFYDYSSGDSEADVFLPENLKTYIRDRMYQYYLAPLFEAIKSGILNKKQIDHIVNEYLDTEKSPFDLANEIGYQNF